MSDYTNSKYAFGECHTTFVLWKEPEFFTLAEKNVSNGTEIQVVLEASKLTREIALVHCPAHTKGSCETKK